MLERLRARVMAMVGRARTTMTDMSGPVQLLQTDHSRHQGLVDKVPFFQHFGFASRPPAQTDVVVLFTNGDLANGTAIASNSSTHRPPDLEEGDGSIYDSRGAYVWLGANGPVVDGAGGDLTIQNCKTITIKGATTVNVDGAETLNVTASEAINFDTPLLKVTGDVIAADVG